MKVSNILMRPELVRASLDGIKTQTRRNRGLRDVNLNPDSWQLLRVGVYKGRFGAFFSRDGSTRFIPCPWGGPDDLVYVRENWQAWSEFDGVKAADIPQHARERINYPADGNKWDAKLRPGIHCPRWANRLTLRLKEVRVERLQDISEEDAKAEGARPAFSYPGWDGVAGSPSYRWGFHELWQSIHGPDSWSANSWLWVLVYKAIAMNVDEVLKLEAA